MVDVQKTYELYLGGESCRSESSRIYQPQGAHKETNVCRASREDLRDAVRHARAALPAWQRRSACQRGQVLYRLAELLEARGQAMVEEIVACTDLRRPAAGKEVDAALDVATFYAGLPDKLNALLGSQNDVSGPFLNFSTVEATGVVGVVAPPVPAPALAGLVALVLPVLAGGNSVVAVVSEAAPLPGLALAEVLAASDVPPGLVNLLAGNRDELTLALASHRDVDGLLVAGEPVREVGELAAESLKRVRFAALADKDWLRAANTCSLFFVEPFVEVKTLWHPVSD